MVAQFTHQYMRLQYPQDVHFGDDISIWIAKAGGDIARRNMILSVTWPATCAVDDSAGTRMIDFLELRHENVLIERHYGESLEIRNDLYVPQGKQSALTTMTGKGITSNLENYNIILPFTIDLPLCALREAPVLRVKFRPSLEFSTIQWTQPIQVSLFVDYAYVSKAERVYLSSTPIFYPVETIQRLIFRVGSNVTQYTFLSQFTRLVKELYWVIQTDGTQAYDFTNQGLPQLVNLNLQFNGVDVISSDVGTPLFLNATQALEFHSHFPTRQFYMYSFALDPENHRQTGEVNFGSIFRQLHTLNLTPSVFSRQIRVYALTYQVLQLRDGAFVSLTDSQEEGGTQITNTGGSYNPIWPGLYYFNAFTFTPLGNTGFTGPTPDQTYPSPPWPPQYFSIHNGQQNWTVPANGTYQITAAGAHAALPGRVVTGQVNLYQGQVLTFLVGQQPTPLTAIVADNITVGGGGGTFIVSNGTLLMVASGGDGSGPTSSPGSFLPSGSGNGQSGAGYLTDGSQSNPFFQFLVPKSYINGGYGAAYSYGNPTVPELGGFGGGQAPLGLVTAIDQITCDGTTATCLTHVLHGYPFTYVVNIQGTIYYDGVQQIQSVPGSNVFSFSSSNTQTVTSGYVSGIYAGSSGGGGYTGSPGDGTSGATCYADSSVQNFTDLGDTSSGDGYVTIQLLS